MLACQILKNEVEEVQKRTSIDAFEKSLSRVLKNHFRKKHSLDILNLEERQMIFERLCFILPVKKALKCFLTDTQLDTINQGYHALINKFKFRYEGEEVALTDFNILAAFYDVIYHGIKNKKRRRYLKEVFAVPFLEGISLLKMVPKIYTACFSILIDYLNDINNKNCSFKMLAKQNGEGMLLTPVFNINAKSRFTQEKELDLLLKLKTDNKLKLHCKTEIQDIYNFKDYNLNINTMQEANYEKFLSYIKQGEDAELTITDGNREKLSLQTHSMGKLLQLLMLNTFGLALASFAKLYYSIRLKFKRLFNKNKEITIRPNLKERAA